MSDFDAPLFRANLASFLDITPDSIQINATAASIAVSTTIIVPSALAANAAARLLEQTEPADLSSVLAVSVESVTIVSVSAKVFDAPSPPSALSLNIAIVVAVLVGTFVAVCLLHRRSRKRRAAAAAAAPAAALKQPEVAEQALPVSVATPSIGPPSSDQLGNKRHERRSLDFGDNSIKERPGWSTQRCSSDGEMTDRSRGMTQAERATAVAALAERLACKDQGFSEGSTTARDRPRHRRNSLAKIIGELKEKTREANGGRTNRGGGQTSRTLAETGTRRGSVVNRFVAFHEKTAERSGDNTGTTQHAKHRRESLVRRLADRRQKTTNLQSPECKVTQITDASKPPRRGSLAMVTALKDGLSRSRGAKAAVSMPMPAPMPAPTTLPMPTAGGWSKVERRASLVEDGTSPGVLRVQLHGAHDLHAANGDGKTSDPYVKLRVGDTEQVSATKKLTLTPSFDETFEFSGTLDDMTEETLDLEVWDANTWGADGLLGEVSVPLDYLRRSAKREFTEVLRLRGVSGEGSIRFSTDWDEVFMPLQIGEAERLRTNLVKVCTAASVIAHMKPSQSPHKAPSLDSPRLDPSSEEVFMAIQPRQAECLRAKMNEVRTAAMAIRAMQPNAAARGVGTFKSSSSGLLRVQLHDAHDLHAANGDGKTSDPYVKLRVGDTEQVSATKKLTLTPSFDETFEFSGTLDDMTEETLDLEVWDANTWGADGLLGEVSVPLDYLRRSAKRTHTEQLLAPTGDAAEGSITFSTEWLERSEMRGEPAQLTGRRFCGSAGKPASSQVRV